MTNNAPFSIFVQRKTLNTRSNKYRFFVKGCRSVRVLFDTFNVYTRCFFIVPNVKVKLHATVRYFFFMIKNIISAIIVVSAAAIAQHSVSFSDVTVIASDSKGMTVEFRPQYYPDKTVKTDRAFFMVPRFAFDAPSPQNLAGAEDIRTRVLSIALPGHSGNTVSVIASDFETIASYSLAPVPHVQRTDDLGSISKSYRVDYRSKNNFYPQQMVELHSLGTVKGVLVGNLTIAPYQYQSSTRTLKRYSRIVIRVNYGMQSATFDETGHDEWAEANLLNYRTAKQWRAAARFDKRMATSSSLLSSGTWVKMEISEDGIYKLDVPYLRSVGIEPLSRPMTDVNVFGGDGKRIPENLSTPRPADLPQIALEYVDHNGNGNFDTDDYILFYGQGVNGWNYDPDQKQFSHYGNPYTFSNYYFLSFGTSTTPKKIQTVSLTGVGSKLLRNVLGKAVFDEDKYNFNQSGQEWVSSPINPGGSQTVITKLNGYIPGTSVTYEYFAYGRSTEGTTMSIDESGQSLGAVSFQIINFSDYHYYAWPASGSATIIPSLTDQRSMVKFKYTTTNNVSTAYIGWLRMFYQQQLTAVGNQLFFAAPDTSGSISFRVNGFTRNDITLFEVSNFSSIRKIHYILEPELGSIVFQDTVTEGTIHRYVCITPDQFKTPKAFVKLPNTNLRGLHGAEFIIITHNDFKSEADRLKQHKESLPGSRKISTIVVDIDTIFNEFGLGMPDPSAMRDFILYGVTQMPVKPKYVLFFGDATYDYRGIIKTEQLSVPTYQTSESNIKISSFANEDYFSYLNPAKTTVALAHGRLTPRTVDDAKVLVDKIIHYETGMSKGQWKNTVTLVADDMVTPSSQSEFDHITQSDDIATISSNRDYEVQRINMEEYTTVFASTGRRKPGAHDAILDQVNKQGTLLLNFVGHGNPKVWAHESVLTQDDVRNQFVNADKLTFIVAATCDWGRFDEAGESSSAEDAVLSRKGGAIGVLSANRAVFSYDNSVTNQRFYEYVFSGKPTLRLGDAYMLTKNALSDYLSSLENKQKYFLLGDPTIVLAAPSGAMMIDSVMTASGATADTLRALEKIIISGTVRDTANNVMTGFTGTATLTVNDAEYKQFVPPVPPRYDNGDAYFSYRKNGAIIYSGQATVSNGRLVASFIVPKDISYTNKNGRISIYFSGTTFDGRGYNKNFVVGGTNHSASSDSVGPEITIYFDNPRFRSGDVVNDNPKLFVALKDSNGINSSTHSIGHRLEAWIDGNTKSIDLTGAYQGTIDSYKEGTAAYTLENLSSGNHSISVRAWDVYNNSSTTEAFFVVASSATLSIQQLFNFPNPVSTTTAFTFQHNQTMPIDVAIRIYTVAGRLIHTIERQAVPDRFVKIDWNRLDHDGGEVGNGVYFYKVTAKTIDGKYTSEAIGKMAIVR